MLGINFSAIGLLEKGEYVRVFAKLGNWYVIQTENNIVGTVYCDYLEPYTDYTESPWQDTTSNLQTNSSIENEETVSTNSNLTEESSSSEYTSALDTPLISYTAEEQEFINLINNER